MPFDRRQLFGVFGSFFAWLLGKRLAPAAPTVSRAGASIWPVGPLDYRAYLGGTVVTHTYDAGSLRFPPESSITYDVATAWGRQDGRAGRWVWQPVEPAPRVATPPTLPVWPADLGRGPQPPRPVLPPEAPRA